MATTPAREFYEKHLEQIAAGRIDEMVDHDYTQDAVLITFFNGFDDSPPPMTIKGSAAIKEFFHKYMEVVGSIDVKTVELAEDFDGTSGGICFQASMNCNLGLVKVGDAWQMRDGKIFYHYGFWNSDKPQA